MRLSEIMNKVLSQYAIYILAFITALGFALRIYNSGSGYPLWIDEAYSVWFSSQSWQYLWGEVPKYETHPPFYYSLLKLWREVFGSDEVALRSLSALASTLVIPLVYASSRILIKDHGRAMALLAAFIAAVWFPQIEHARSARPYAFLALAMSLSLLCFAYIYVHLEQLSRSRFKEIQNKTPLILSMIGLAIGMALLQWFHNLGIFYNLSIALALLIGWIFIGRARVGLFMLMAAIGFLALIFYAPNIPNILMQTEMVSSNFWLKAPSIRGVVENFGTIYGLPLYKLLSHTPIASMGSKFMWVNALGVVLLISTAFTAFFLLLRRQCSSLQSLVITASIGFMTFLPTVLSLLVTFTIKPIFLDRTLLAVQIPLFITYASIPFIFKGMHRKILIVLIVLIPTTWTVSRLYIESSRPVENERGMGEIVKIIRENPSLGSVVFVYPNYVELLADYYAGKDGEGIDFTPIPAPYPVLDTAEYEFPAGGAVPSVSAKDIDRIFVDRSVPQTIWFIGRNLGFYDPEGAAVKQFSSYYQCSKLKYGANGILQLRLFSNDPEICATKE